MHQHGLFDIQQRHDRFKQVATLLEQLNSIVDWEAYRPTLETIRKKQRKSNAGRKPLDVVFMFTILILPSLYNLASSPESVGGFLVRSRFKPAYTVFPAV